MSWSSSTFFHSLIFPNSYLPKLIVNETHRKKRPLVVPFKTKWSTFNIFPWEMPKNHRVEWLKIRMQLLQSPCCMSKLIYLVDLSLVSVCVSILFEVCVKASQHVIAEMDRHSQILRRWCNLTKIVIVQKKDKRRNRKKQMFLVFIQRGGEKVKPWKSNDSSSSLSSQVQTRWSYSPYNDGLLFWCKFSKRGCAKFLDTCKESKSVGTTLTKKTKNSKRANFLLLKS